MSRGGIRDLRYSSGAFGGAAVYAFAARRHMALYGTTSEDLGQVAITTRQWAASNPLAVFREPLTMEAYLASRLVSEPFHLYDCAIPVEGAIAVIVSSSDAARSLPRPPVYLPGYGQGHPGRPRQRPFEGDVVTGPRQAKAKAFGMAGVTTDDVDMVQLYDSFTYMTILALEEYGFCAKGRGGEFVREGHIAPGGRLPANTGGGHLSGYYLQRMTAVGSDPAVAWRGRRAPVSAPRSGVGDE